jgi:uncharacterized repeat protein (TIGR03803 family)
VFKLNTDGTGFALLKQFTPTDDQPMNLQAGLTLSGSTLYGTTKQGGTLGRGTVFRLNTNGADFTVLHQFAGSNGSHPAAGLVLVGNTLYGTTEYGGSADHGTVFQVNTDGTGFAVLKHFDRDEGLGAYPEVGLVFADNALYGTSRYGGDFDHGVIFKIELDAGVAPIPLLVETLDNAIVLRWTNATFALQAAPLVAGIYTNVPGATSPYTNALSGQGQFFRLIAH